MSLEEAKALVLREGLSGPDPPDDAVALRLHEGCAPDAFLLRRLIQAIDVIHAAIDEEAVIDRPIAGALWLLGCEASNALGGTRVAKEQDDLIALLTAVESAFVGFWPIGHARDTG